MREQILIVILPVLSVAAVAACNLPKATTEEPNGDAGGMIDNDDRAQTPNQPAGTGGKTGISCDVQAVIENRCRACHDKNDPSPLLTYEDLVAPSKRDPSKKRAEVSLELMKAGTMPPKPAVPAEDDESEAFEAWVKAGLKPNPQSCTSTPPAPKGGATTSDGGLQVDSGGGGGDGDAGGGGGTGTVCTSGKTWTGGNERSPLMHPGAACNACHQQSGGPNLRIAGTVFPTLHEPNDCVGSQSPMTVTITDAANETYALEVNTSGNFLLQAGIIRNRLRAPYKVVVSANGKTRAMAGTVTSGDCNSCHTAEGKNGAPGRIQAP